MTLPNSAEEWNDCMTISLEQEEQEEKLFFNP